MTDQTQPLISDAPEEFLETCQTEEAPNDNPPEKTSEEAIRIAELEEQVLRLSADLQNIRRRSDGDKMKARFEGSAKVVLSLAKTVDDLHRAFLHLPEDIATHPFIVSLQAVEKNLQKTMNSEEIIFFGEAGDSFDEKLHESLIMDATAPENTVAQVFEKGILFRGEVIRHAKVSVGRT